METPIATSLDTLVAAIEGAERRKDSRISRDVQVALPHELDAADRIQLTTTFATAIATRYHTLASWAVHEPHRHDDGDPRNVHAHIVIPTRRLNDDGTLGAKLTALDHARTSQHEIQEIRQLWERTANELLAERGITARVDVGRRDDGDPAPTLGPERTALERKARQRRRQRTRGVALAELVSDGGSVTGTGRRLERHTKRRRRRHQRRPRELTTPADTPVLEEQRARPEPTPSPQPRPVLRTELEHRQAAPESIATATPPPALSQPLYRHQATPEPIPTLQPPLGRDRGVLRWLRVQLAVLTVADDVAGAHRHAGPAPTADDARTARAYLDGDPQTARPSLTDSLRAATAAWFSKLCRSGSHERQRGLRIRIRPAVRAPRSADTAAEVLDAVLRSIQQHAQTRALREWERVLTEIFGKIAQTIVPFEVEAARHQTKTPNQEFGLPMHYGPARARPRRGASGPAHARTPDAPRTDDTRDLEVAPAQPSLPRDLDQIAYDRLYGYELVRPTWNQRRADAQQHLLATGHSFDRAYAASELVTTHLDEIQRTSYGQNEQGTPRAPPPADPSDRDGYRRRALAIREAVRRWRAVRPHVLRQLGVEHEGDRSAGTQRRPRPDRDPSRD